MLPTAAASTLSGGTILKKDFAQTARGFEKGQEHTTCKLCGSGARQKVLDLQFRSLTVDPSRGVQEVADSVRLTGVATRLT